MPEPGCRLLLVEDNALIALAEEANLKREGFAVLRVSDGESAISAIRSGLGGESTTKIGLILMDIDLGPGMDGIEATRRILELADLPVLFLSAHTEKEFADRADLVGAYGYLVKNSGIRVITASIRMALHLHEARRLLKVRETELADNEARLRFALEGSNDGVWDVWMRTGQVYLSPRSCEILGYGVLEAAETLEIWSDLVHPDDMAATMDRLNAHLEGREALFRVDQRLRTKTGGWKWVHTRGKVVMRDEAGLALRMTGTHTDLSELRETEDRFEAELKARDERIRELEARLLDEGVAPVRDPARQN